MYEPSTLYYIIGLFPFTGFPVLVIFFFVRWCRKAIAIDEENARLQEEEVRRRIENKLKKISEKDEKKKVVSEQEKKIVPDVEIITIVEREMFSDEL